MPVGREFTVCPGLKERKTREERSLGCAVCREAKPAPQTRSARTRDKVVMSGSGDGTYSPGDGTHLQGSSDAHNLLQNFWPQALGEIRNMTLYEFKVQELPLARIKKIMKMDEDVKMISAEAPVLFAKAAQIFIRELSLRAWIHTEDNKRRTLQRNDIAMAISKFDQFDFLIDIVPRDELKPVKRQEEVRQVMAQESVQYYFTLAQPPMAISGQTVQGSTQQQNAAQGVQTAQAVQTVQAATQQGQTAATPVTVSSSIQPGIVIAQAQQGQVSDGQTMQILAPQGAGGSVAGAGQTMQVMQQIITNTGEIQHVPVQLNPGQLQYIRLAQPVSAGTQMVHGQVQTLAASGNPPQLFQIQQVTLPSGQEGTQSVFLQQGPSTDAQPVAVDQVQQ
uniref:Nuclear transcription factor Y subunit gamma n=1 Tax=Eptatretus burgeri TaxID=7764 RepID=A0A8C4N151_EPTBU